MSFGEKITLLAITVLLFGPFYVSQDAEAVGCDMTPMVKSFYIPVGEVIKVLMDGYDADFDTLTWQFWYKWDGGDWIQAFDKPLQLANEGSFGTSGKIEIPFPNPGTYKIQFYCSTNNGYEKYSELFTFVVGDGDVVGDVVGEDVADDVADDVSGKDFAGYGSWDEYCEEKYGSKYYYDAERDLCVDFTTHDSMDEYCEARYGSKYYFNAERDLCDVRDTDVVPSKDTDGDTIPDSIDECPQEPETINNLFDYDGCPDTTTPKLFSPNTTPYEYYFPTRLPEDFFKGNGCGSTDWTRIVPDLDFAESCNAHDICYEIGGDATDRKNCDDAFYESIKANSVLGKYGAMIYYGGVRLFGDDAFNCKVTSCTILDYKLQKMLR